MEPVFVVKRCELGVEVVTRPITSEDVRLGQLHLKWGGVYGNIISSEASVRVELRPEVLPSLSDLLSLPRRGGHYLRSIADSLDVSWTRKCLIHCQTETEHALLEEATRDIASGEAMRRAVETVEKTLSDYAACINTTITKARIDLLLNPPVDTNELVRTNTTYAKLQKFHNIHTAKISFLREEIDKLQRDVDEIAAEMTEMEYHAGLDALESRLDELGISAEAFAEARSKRA